MKKNIIVTDEQGQQIGLTYPKRAKGLVKNGRAEYTSDCSIKMLDTRDPASDNTEVRKMSNVINFNARDFHFNAACESNVGSRMITTDKDGNSVESFTIGDWHWSWTEIMSTRKLGRDFNGVFRFELHGGYNSTDDATSRFSVILHREEAYTDAEYQERFVYQIERSSYKPLISKKMPNGHLIRVYEIPFNTGDCEYATFAFTAMHAEQTMFPASDNESYSALDDMTYEQMTAHRDADEAANHSSLDRKSFDGYSTNMQGAVISEEAFANMLSSIGDGCDISFQGCKILKSENHAYLNIGRMTDGSDFDLSGSELTFRALSMIIAKLGDGCCASLCSSTITDNGESGFKEYEISPVDGTVIDLNGLKASQKALNCITNLISMKSGDGSVVNMQGVVVLPDGNK